MAAERVRFLGVPIDAYLALQEWNDAVMRECELINALGPGHSYLPPRLVDLAAASSGRFAPESDELRETVDRARRQGLAIVDLVGAWTVPVESAVDAAAAFVATMEELDGFCRTDVLLTEAPDPVVIRLRRWFVTEMQSQLLAGSAPTAF